MKEKQLKEIQQDLLQVIHYILLHGTLRLLNVIKQKIFTSFQGNGMHSDGDVDFLQ